MCKFCWVLVAVLVLAVAGMSYKFVFEGSVERSEDMRLALQLTEHEKNFVLAEMRAFLASVQQITEGAVKDDMYLVANAGRAAGASNAARAPGSLMGKLPLGFKRLGFATPSAFDELALDAEQLGDKEHALKQLSDLMQNCVGCHAAYRIETVVE